MTGRRAKLNVFQKTLRVWDTMHPYNAAQAMELAVDYPAGQVATAFNDALRDLGLGEFVCDGRFYTIEPNVADVEVVRPVAGFEAHLSAEINRPFPAGRTMPFRPFDILDHGRRLIGLTYQHWVADSLSIRLLTRQWLRRLTGGGGPWPVRLPEGGMLKLFGPGTAGWSAVAHAATALGQSSLMKRMRRMEPKLNADVAVMSRDGPDGLVDAVKARAKAAGATVGDVLLAAGALACDAEGPTHPTTKRPDLCMGTIVDLRARHGRAESREFGFYLGFTMTPYTAAEIADPSRTLARTTRERRTTLARKSAEASQLNLAIGYTIGRAIGPERLTEFYRKRFALAGGLSSVNMTPGWAGAFHPSPLTAYLRVSPTGPMLPLALTPTTLGRSLRVCCTYRTALVDAPRAGRLTAAFFAALRGYADGRAGR